MPRTGRPRGFDRDQALTTAMHRFWRDGFEGVSIDQLRKEMGKISSGSFYAAFESKETLYREALAAYVGTHNVVPAALRDESRSPRERIERALRGFAANQAPSSLPSGCMVTLSATVGSSQSSTARALAAEERALTRAAFEACVEEAIDQGELRRDAEPAGLVILFEALLLGISIQARDGIDPSVLDQAITQALRAWDANRSV